MVRLSADVGQEVEAPDPLVLGDSLRCPVVGRAEVKYVIRKEGFPQVRLGLVHDLTPEQARYLASWQEGT